MKILITGGAGFIGGHLAERFAGDCHDVVVLDNLDPYYSVEIKQHNVELVREATVRGDCSYEFVEDDVRKEAPVKDLVDGTDFVFHEESQARVRTSVENTRH